MHDATLCYLVKPGEVLLAMKKVGFGRDRWNGVGGKPEKDETMEDAVVREVGEEIGVRIEKTDLEKVAVIDFYFEDVPKEKDWDQTVHVYLARKWKGEPVESEEMRPQWFSYTDPYSTDELPYGIMWVDDEYWLPLVLDGKKLNARFVFTEKGAAISDKEIIVTDVLR